MATTPHPERALRRALVVIARDEAPRIARLLASLKPWVDEMLVLDTGSVDGTALDADEWLTEGGAALAALRHTAPAFVGALRLDDHGAAAGLVQHWLSRVLPGGVRYSGSVHEQPVHSLPVQRRPLVVGHDGYAPERLAAKRGRNRALLLAELAQTPGDAYCWYQLGKDHAVYDKHMEAAAELSRREPMPG